MPFLNLEWTSNRIQFFGEVDLFSVLSGLLYRNEWSSISGILNLCFSIYIRLMDRLQDKWYLDCKRQYYCVGFPTSLYYLFPTF